MTAKTQNQKIILGLKVKQLRQQKELTFSDIKDKTGMSISYLNEIERGKKYPKADKIQLLADAFGVDEKVLSSTTLTGNLVSVGELLQSNFLHELPLDMFGIDLMKVVEIIANAPTRIGAFISTLVELSRNYALREENFYQGAMRAYQELHFNYFEDLETAADDFIKKHQFPIGQPIPVTLLENILKKEYQYKLVENGLDAYPELGQLRSVFVPKSKQLLLNGKLTNTQRSFQYCKEIAFQYLKLEHRAYTSSLLKVNSFEQVLSHYKAVYFATALLINRPSFREDLEDFFKRKTWSGEAFLALPEKYKVSPEIMVARLTNLIPRYLGLKKFFFIRMMHNSDTDAFTIDKELHLNHSHHPHGNSISEHYCRRWMSVSLLNDLKDMQTSGKYAGIMVGAQRSQYFGTEDEYLCLTLARPNYGSGKLNSSVTIGLLLDENTKQTIGFANDPNIVTRVVNKTCERCEIKDCEQRVRPAVIVAQREQKRKIQERLKEILR